MITPKRNNFQGKLILNDIGKFNKGFKGIILARQK